MAKAEMVFQFVEIGSNSMTTFQALMSAVHSPNDSLSLMQNGTNVVATIQMSLRCCNQYVFRQI